MKIIELKKLHFQYPNGIKVFEDLDFSIESGDRIGISGKNGSGKTTLFSLMTGLLTPSSGRLLFWGNQITQEDDFKPIRKKIGFLFQDPDDQLFCPTVEEDIVFGPLNLGMDLSDIQKDLNDLCSEFGIADLKHRVPFHLSWGQKRLVSLAGALIMKPEVLIMDEPTASVDEEVIEKMVNYLKKIECTMVIASHDNHFLDQVTSEKYTVKNKKLSLTN